MLSLMLPYLLTAVVFLLLLGILGRVLNKFVFNNIGGSTPFATLFFDLLLAIIVSVTVYSLIITGAKTVNLGFLIILGLLFKETRAAGNNTAAASPLSKVLGFSALVFLLGVSYGVFKVYVGGDFPWVVYKGADYAYHSMLSEGLAIKGYENKFIPEQLLTEGFPGIHLFHFFDLWTASLLSTVTGLNNYILHNTVVDPLLILLSSLGFLAVVEQFSKVKPVHYLVALLVLGFSYVHLPFYNVISYLSPEFYRIHHFGGSALILPKLFQVVPFAFAIAYALSRSDYVQMTLWVFALAIVYMSAIPVVISASLLFLLLMKLLKQVDNKQLIRAVVYLMLAGLFFIVLYKLYGTGISEGKDKLSLDLFDLSALKTRINIMGLTTIQMMVFFMPHMVLLGIGLVYAYRSGKMPWQSIKAVIFALLIVVMGLLAWVATYKNQDGMQLLGNNFPLVNMLLLLALIMLYSGPMSSTGLPQWLKGVFYSLLLLLMGSNYVSNAISIDSSKSKVASEISTDYLLEVSQTNSGADQALIGVYYKGYEEYNDSPFRDAQRTSQSFKLNTYLVFMPQYLSTTNLSVFDFEPSKAPLAREREEKATSGTAFFKFIEE